MRSRFSAVLSGGEDGFTVGVSVVEMERYVS